MKNHDTIHAITPVTEVRNPEHARTIDTAALSRVVEPGQELAVALLAATPDCVKLLDLTGALTFMSFQGRCAMEITDEDPVIGARWWDLWPAEMTERLQQAVADAGKRVVSDFVAFCPTARGTPRWWAVTVSPILGQDGQVGQILAVSRDVTGLVDRQTELQEALKHADLLRREVDHRVKNSLGLVSSMLNLKARSAHDENVATALKDAAMRVRTIASVHDRLYRTAGNVPVDDYIASLVADIQLSLGGAVTFHFDGLGQDLKMAPDVSLAIGLIVAELTGNALRHGDLGDDGSVAVMLAVVNDTLMRLTVADSGCGLPADFDVTRGGMGMTVVQSMVQKIGGTLSAGRAPDGGARFDVTFPIA